MSQNKQKTDTFKSSLQVEIYSVLKKLYPQNTHSIIQDNIDLTHPKEENHGDYSSALCLKISKILGQRPIEIAQKIKGELDKDEAKLKNLGVVKVEVEAPGFLNFWMSEEFFITELVEVLENGSNFGKNFVTSKNLENSLKKLSKNIKLYHPALREERGKSKIRIMVEYAHPNTHKEFHIGHLRNITLAEVLIRLMENLGIEVIRVNYQGDVGMHIAKALWALLQNSKFKIQNSKLWNIYEKVEFLGKAYVEGNKAYEESEEAKKEIIEINRKIYAKDSGILPLWKETRQWSLDYFEKIYKRVGSRYDRYYFESEVYEPGKKIVEEFLEKGVFQKSDGAVIFPGEKYGLHNRVFITGVGFPTYEAKDMGLGVLQFKEYNPDLIIHIVSAEQIEYFKVVIEALSQILSSSRGKELHFIYGWVQLKEGKMSSRKGNVVTGRWLLDEAKKKAALILKDSKENYSEKEVEEITEKVALAAVKYAMLKFAARSDILFDFDESVSLEGDSGPYLLYTYARARSVLRKIKNYELKIKNLENVKNNSEELSLLRTLYRFPEVSYEAGANFAPNLICSYLFDLAQKYNLFYTKHSILNPPAGEKSEEIKQFRLALTQATSTVLKNGLHLLGIRVLERM